ncbi:non-ribosomal peptide synthetase [Actinokineospora iranica]|uniref:non-ribosomal peptide synthetase n=1 Tax=Actinokineospora iranica TaxID=1271860 RepID=UPI00226BCDE8|nr:non-ribosomal peptide synthetase [Actinokineospora iranica]
MARDGGVRERVRAAVVRVLAELLPAGVAPDLGASLRAYGLDSMAAARLWLALQTEFSVDIPIDWVGRSADFAELVERVAGHLGSGAVGGVSRATGVVVRADDASAGEPFGLTPIQQAYVLGKQAELTPDAVGCHLYREFEVDDLDVDRLRDAWARLVAHHDMLRVVLTADGRQRVAEGSPEWTLEVHDLASTGAVEQERHVAEVRKRLSHKAYPVGAWPLFDVEVTVRGDGGGRVHLSLDAVITDGHGLALLLTQWAALYRDPDYVLPTSSVSVRDCLGALTAQEETPGYAADLDYWVELLRDLPDGPALGDAPGRDDVARRPIRDSLSAREWAAIRELAGAWDVSPTSLVLTLFAEVLARHGGQAPFSLVVTTNNRVRLPGEVANLVGPFTASALFLADATAGVRLDEAAARTHKQLWQAVQHSSVCGVAVQRELRARRAVRRQVSLPVVFTSMVDAIPDGADGGFAAQVDYAVSQTSGVALDHQMWQQNGELHLQWDVADAMVGPGVADAAFADLVNDLRELATTPRFEVRRLNELQQAYFVARAGEATAWDGCQVHTSFHLDGDLDIARLEAAALRVIGAYDVLRGAVSGDGRIRVRRDTASRWRVPVTEVSDVDQHGAIDAATRDAMVGAAFPLARWHHFDLRVTRSRAGATVHFAVDLLLADAVSIHLIARELLRVYLDPSAEPRPQAPYAEQRAAREHARLASDFLDWQRHWRERLADLPPGPEITTQPRASAGRRRTRLTGEIRDWAGFAQRCERHGVTADAVLLAVLGKALSVRFTDEFSVSVVRFPEAQQRFRPAELTSLSWVRRGPADRSVVAAAQAYQAELDADARADAVSGLAELRKIVNRERRTGTYAFPVVYTSMFRHEPLPTGARAGEWMTYTPDVSLDCIGELDADGFRFCWDVVEADFPDGAVAAMFAEFTRLVRALEDDDAAWTGGGDERHKILVEWNATARDFPCAGPIHLAFERHATLTPEAVALRWPGGTMTYGELNRQANAIAWRLKRRGVGPETVVGIGMRRGPEMIAAVLGILKADGLYLPVEPGLPAERAAVMLAEARCSIVLTTTDTARWPVAASIEVIEVDADTAEDAGSADTNPVPTASVDNRAYIIFTSGSTGKPKGVAVTHRPVHNLLNWCYRTFHFGPSDVGLCVTSLGFDLSVFDIFGMLGCGACLYIADAAQQRDPELLLDLLLTEPITFWNSAPTTLNQLAPLLAAKQGHPGTRDLRLVFLSGDYTPLSLPDELRPVFPNAEMISLGGATEATVWSNWFRIGEIEPAWRSIPYGKPIDNARYHVLDENLEPVPVGVEGDLYIGGVVLSLGYVNRPDLTAERFIDDPFHPGEKLYMTGDRASYFPDGNLCFLGRADNQVKIRGFRVELGEIEHRLRQHESVTEVVVLARDDGSGDRKLVAYVIPAGDTPPSVRELRVYAGQTLPEYMVPNFVGFVDTFPATANGKLDRDALPWPVTDRPKPEKQRTGPSHEQLISEIAAIFAERLGLPTVDPTTDLWDQGATSFTMVQVSNALHDRYGTRVPVSALLNDPTVASIARQLGPVEAVAAEPEPEPVDLFSPEQQKAFKSAKRNRRPVAPGERVVRLDDLAPPREHFAWRASRREFDAGPLPYAAFSRFLGLLRETSIDGRTRLLYPSAGDTYSVQVYLHIRPNAVEGVGEGVYYYDPAGHELRLITAKPKLDRSHHFFYNRPVYDASGFGVYLIGQTHGIEPLYQEESLRYLTLEAGYLGQVLLMGQAAAGVGLCPIGAVSLTEDFALDDGHVFLHGFLGGPAEHEPSGNGVRPPFESHSANPGGEPDESAGRGDRRDSGDVAVIGMAGRFPGADGLAEFWQNLRSGRRSTGPVPAGRRAALSPGGETGLTGGFLDAIDSFDALLFHTSPDEARTLDPQARLLLQTVWEALENAGHTADSLSRQSGRVGVFIGSMWQDYRQVGAEAWQRGAAATVSATASDIANRISYFFDFRGPSIAVDTSCSSSLAALHLAVESLRRGECDAAVVGAANLLAHPYHLRLLDDLGLVTTSGGQSAFDNTASGWAPGEGCGVIVLRPAAAAVAEHDVVRGIIEGTWIGHSGRSSRFGAPNADALAESMARALAEAGREPSEVDYVECAAAGASVADAAELEALGAVFADAPRPVPVGTVKPNIGHLEAASGLSQLIKVLLQLEHGQIAPTLAADERSALIAWHDLPVTLVDAPQPLRASAADGRVRAMVNAVGATGTYGHVLVRGPEPRVPQPGPAGRKYPVLLSAATAPALKAAARNLYEHLADRHASGAAPAVAEIAYTLQTGRAHLPHRLALTAADIPELLACLRGYLAGRPVEGMFTAEVDAALAAARVEPADKYDAVASWIEGYHVEWHRYWLPPSSRVSLPTYPFAAERHWLDAGLPEPEPPQVEPPVIEPVLPEDELPAVAPLPREVSEDTVAFVKRAYSEASGIPVARLHPRVPLEHYGLNSQLIAKVNALLQAEFSDVPRTLFFEHADLAGVAGALESLIEDGPEEDDDHKGGSEGDWPWQDAPGDIAVIGIAGRYPQADDLDTFWRNLLDGRDCVTPLPADRARPGWPTDLMWGGFLSDVDTFDPLLFSITPRDAELMDPQERLFLQIAWETLEDAGYTRARLAERHDSKVGVFAGVMYNEYPFFGVERTQAGTPADAGSAVAGIANRVSYFLDLTGPSLAVDTMCSSSLTALHLAVESLRRGECAVALAGGVNLSLHPNKFIQQDRLKMSSTDHRCRAFGKGGDGFVPAEGVGAVLLKPLAHAVADGDRVHAVIKGTAINHGGKTNGYMVPNPVAQGALVLDALRRAGVDPATIGYLEAHGTGTELGDPVEVNGLTRAFAGTTLAPGACAIGSVKSNIGHPEAAAGIAALTKVILQLRHRTLVPSLHADEPNPNIDWASSPFRVQTRAEAWQAARGADGTPLPRRAGVSSFGAGGANAHVVVEEFVAAPRQSTVGGPQLIVLSARDAEALRAVAGRLAGFLRDSDAPAAPVDYDALLGQLRRIANGEVPAALPGNGSTSPQDIGAYLIATYAGERTASGLPALADIAHTLQIGREPLRERLAVVARDHGHLLAELDRHLAGQPSAVVTGRTPGATAPPGALAAAGTTPPDEHELRGLADHWVGGGRVDWATLHASPARITGLPSYPFDRKRYWLPEPTSLTVPLHVPVWTPADFGARTFTGQAVVLHTAATAALARQVGDLLGARPVAEGQPIPEADGVLDLTDLDGAERPWEPRLAALRSLVSRARGRDLRILQVTRGLLGPAGPAPSLAGGVVAGFVRMLGAEYPRVAAAVLDVDELTAGTIAAEFSAESKGDVAVRGAVRLVPRLAPLTPAQASVSIDPARTYLVTGGTRGIGALVARHLVSRGARKIALAGLRPVAPDIADLEQAGAEVIVHTGPLTDRAALARFLDRARALGPIGGVVHCAGRGPAGRPSFVHKENDDLAAVLAPKVDGLRTLAELCAGDWPDFFVLFSSLSAVVPGLASGVLDYSAANAYLDLFADHQVRTGRPYFRSVNWPTWRAAGMGAAQPDGCASVGVDSLTDAEGLALLDVASASPHSRLVPARPLNAGVDIAALPAHAARTTQAEPVPERVPEPVTGPPSWLYALFSELLGIPVAELDPSALFEELGVESVMLAELMQRIEARLGRRLEPGTLLSHPTLNALSAALGADRAPTRQAPVTPQPGPAIPTGREIAVVGMACRFPDAPDTNAFWANLTAKRCSVSEVPASRWDKSALYPHASISKWGGFVEGIEDFDADYFGMTEEEATCLDPAIRLFLETTAAAMADAGYPEKELWGRDVGVFVGARMSNYRERTGARGGAAGMGTDQNFVAARVAHQFDFRGPNMVVDSACSSSLVGIQLACRSLLDGESEVAVAGGVDVLLDEQPYLEFSAAGALSPDGRCFTFDERANGFVPGEGCGVVLLKTLDRALADGDRVHAVIRAVAVNNDGHTMGLTTPNPSAQAKVVRRALARSGLSAREIGLVEAHGTGTMIGDPIEVRALTDVYRETTEDSGFCAIGSVKSNVGHLLSAAGMAGLLKVVLALKHRQLPPTLFCETPNPRFDFAASPFTPNTTLRPWDTDGVRAAGVSAFGLGGTNAHLIVAEHTGAPGREPLPAPVFHRKRHWIDRTAGTETAATVAKPPAAVPSPATVVPPPAAPVFGASILDLKFTPAHSRSEG